MGLDIPADELEGSIGLPLANILVVPPPNASGGLGTTPIPPELWGYQRWAVGRELGDKSLSGFWYLVSPHPVGRARDTVWTPQLTPPPRLLPPMSSAPLNLHTGSAWLLPATLTPIPTLRCAHQIEPPPHARAKTPVSHSPPPPQNHRVWHIWEDISECLVTQGQLWTLESTLSWRG